MPPQVTNWQYDASRDYIVDARQSRQSLSFQKRVVERVKQEPVARLRVVSEASNLAQLNRILKAMLTRLLTRLFFFSTRFGLP
jgi:hypothetical protein